MPLRDFHPAVAAWFAGRFAAPTPPQVDAWPAIRQARHTLIAAPTGSGKTLAAFLAVIDDLVQRAQRAPLPDATQIVYVSPLKALAADVQRNLMEPLDGIQAQLRAMGLPDAPIRTLLRTGDTPAHERQQMVRRPPHILVTTPESLFILLTSESGRRMLQTARTVIVDEIHAVVQDKRGAHLALSLARLDALCGRRLVRVGLSATQRPIAEVARFLVGGPGVAGDGAVDCAIVDHGHQRQLDLALELPGSPLSAVMAGEVWEEIYDRLAALAAERRTTLVFVHTRRLAERVSRHLGERLGEVNVAAHHGSLSRERRLAVEQRLKSGELRVLVATAALELGIDIGSVDLVCLLGSPRSIASVLQRVGRSGHFFGGVSRGRLFPLSRDELVECIAVIDAARRGQLETVRLCDAPLDILAQQLVAEVAGREWDEQELRALVNSAWPYRKLAREQFDEVVAMLAEGFHTRRGRRGALLHHDAVNGRLRPRRGARLTAITSGGAIPDNADYNVVLEPGGTFVGTLNEDFAIESAAGDVFQLGDRSWRVLRIEQGRVLVADAQGAPPNIPFWLGEAPGRSDHLSAAVSQLRARVAAALDRGPDVAATVVALAGELQRELQIDLAAATQAVEHLAAARAALGAIPTQEHLILERFFDEAGDLHLVLHSPYGSRLNRAFGLALRKRFCRTFNFELQAAATEDAIVLSLGPTHSFPPADVFHYLRAATVAAVLEQAVLDAPMFGVRWRWNVTRSLALPRWRAGRRTPAPLLRMQAEDLLAIVFPDQLACAENLVGDRAIPDHPLVQQTLRDCVREAMDLPGLTALLQRIEAGAVRCTAVELTEPSPLAHEVLNARPYAFLDDAPLEERRTQAVMARRWIDLATAADLGRLDPQAIQQVRGEIAPQPQNADELHDALVVQGFLTAEEGAGGGWASLFAELVAARRAATLVIFDATERPPERAPQPGPTRGERPAGPLALWVAAERAEQARALWAQGEWRPSLQAPPRERARQWTADEALVDLVRSRLEGSGPTTVAALAASFGCSTAAITQALLRLEAEGTVMQGRYTPAAASPSAVVEWCDRRLLARIHRLTLSRLRREIEPVSPAEFMRFLFAWQRVVPEQRAEGLEGLGSVIEQLEGCPAPAAGWEEEILPSRMRAYDPAWLDALCLSGRVVWGRASLAGERTAVVRTSPIALVRRASAPAWQALAAEAATSPPPRLSTPARAVIEQLRERGACFFEELVERTGLLRTQVEAALAELVAGGAVSADSYAGLRALVQPRRARGRPRPRRRHLLGAGIEQAGRWYLRTRGGENAAPAATAAVGSRGAADAALEVVARVLLRRYGVVFRRVLEREPGLPPWRDLLGVLRRLEARGEIRGGRFVDLFSGEQFALGEAVGSLRQMRRTARDGALIAISAADPLNLTGLLTPGERVPALVRNRVLYRDGEPIAVLEAGRARLLVEAEPPRVWELEQALVRRAPAPVAPPPHS